jgi:glutathione S-transferase
VFQRLHAELAVSSVFHKLGTRSIFVTMTKPRLTYFDAPVSRGEECRLALFLAGVDFEDNRIPRDAWSALKPNTPFGCVPTLELPGKPTVSQSNAILGHIGRRYGLLPSDDWEAMRLESLMCAAEDLRHAVTNTFGIEDKEELKKRRTKLVEGPIKTWGANMEKQISGPFASGSEISVADIKLFVLLGWFKKGVLEHVPTDVLDGYAKLEKLFDSVKAHPKVVEWYARTS